MILAALIVLCSFTLVEKRWKQEGEFCQNNGIFFANFLAQALPESPDRDQDGILDQIALHVENCNPKLSTFYAAARYAIVYTHSHIAYIHLHSAYKL